MDYAGEPPPEEQMSTQKEHHHQKVGSQRARPSSRSHIQVEHNLCSKDILSGHGKLLRKRSHCFLQGSACSASSGHKRRR